MKNHGETKQRINDSFWSHREDFTEGEEEEEEKNGNTDINPSVHGKHVKKRSMCLGNVKQFEETSQSYELGLYNGYK